MTIPLIILFFINRSLQQVQAKDASWATTFGSFQGMSHWEETLGKPRYYQQDYTVYVHTVSVHTLYVYVQIVS